ncbi:MAG: alpha-galactosidase [Acidobacteriaceae bacterium]|nr:alpha-galactosidase [Acidobacteriaceae bacterium]
MLRCLLALLAVVSTSEFASAGSDAKKLSGDTWSIGNQFVERKIVFTRKYGLQTDSLFYKVTGHDFTADVKGASRTAGEFSFMADGHELTGNSSFVLEGSNVSVLDGGRLLRVDLSNLDTHLDVSVFYAVYDEHPAIRKWITVTNRGTTARYLSRFCFETLNAGPGALSDLEVSGGYGGTPRELFFTGRVSDPAVFIRSAKTGEGFAILNEAPGYLKRTEIGSGWSERFVVMYDTDLFPFGRTLEPGETFESAKSSLVFFYDNHDLNDPRWVIPLYETRVIARRHGTGQPAWIFNTWEPFLRNVNQQIVGELAPIANEMGLDIFTIDDGWQLEYGSNDFDTTRFPAGFQNVKGLLDRNHLRLGLWVPLAAISTRSPDYQSHPEWVCRDEHRAPKFTGTAAGQRAVMCLASGYRDLALKRLTQLIERYHPAYIKVDLTTVFNAYGEQPGCYATNHSHRGWAESLTRIYEALEYLGNQLYRTHPEVLIDYTFELWGEKHLIDPALLGSADLDWLSNVNDSELDAAGPLSARMLLYTRALSIPAETMLIGNLRATTPSIEERLATEIAAAPLLLGDLRKVSPTERLWYGEKIRWFKDLRSRVALNDSFFPLGSWMQPNAAAWDGFARLSRHSDGMIVLFRNQSNAEDAEIRLPVATGVAYGVKSVMTNRSLGTITSDELMRGWKVKLPAPHRIEIIELDRGPRTATQNHAGERDSPPEEK